MLAVISIILFLAIIGVVVFYNYKQKKEQRENEYYQSMNEDKELGEINTPSKSNVFESKYTSGSRNAMVSQTSIKGNVVIAIGVVVLVLSIIAAIICFAASGSTHNKAEWISMNMQGGYLILAGLVIFGVLFGIGHILKTNEERNEMMKKKMEEDK